MKQITLAMVLSTTTALASRSSNLPSELRRAFEEKKNRKLDRLQNLAASGRAWGIDSDQDVDVVGPEYLLGSAEDTGGNLMGQIQDWLKIYDPVDEDPPAASRLLGSEASRFSEHVVHSRLITRMEPSTDMDEL